MSSELSCSSRSQKGLKKKRQDNKRRRPISAAARRLPRPAYGQAPQVALLVQSGPADSSLIAKVNSGLEIRFLFSWLLTCGLSFMNPLGHISVPVEPSAAVPVPGCISAMAWPSSWARWVWSMPKSAFWSLLMILAEAVPLLHVAPPPHIELGLS